MEKRYIDFSNDEIISIVKNKSCFIYFGNVK